MSKKQHHKSIRLFVGLVALYLLISTIIPINHATQDAYGLSAIQSRVLSLVTVLPLFGIWFIAFYCYGLLQRYAKMIHKAKEGFAFKKLADGLMILSWGLVVQAFASLILNSFGDQFPGFHGTAIVMQNYISLIFPVIAFSAIATGTRHLLSGKHNYASLPASRTMLVLFALIGALYSYLILHLRWAEDGGAFYLPPFLLLSTIVIPYLYAWFSGLIAAYDISLYAQVTRGVLYKKALRKVASGLVVLIIASILVQYLNSLILASVGNIALNMVLIFDYLLLFGVGVGYGLMASGVTDLQKIEEI